MRAPPNMCREHLHSYSVLGHRPGIFWVDVQSFTTERLNVGPVFQDSFAEVPVMGLYNSRTMPSVLFSWGYRTTIFALSSSTAPTRVNTTLCASNITGLKTKSTAKRRRIVLITKESLRMGLEADGRCSTKDQNIELRSSCGPRY